MADPATMTNGAIGKEYSENCRQQSEINKKLIDDGYGSLRFSDMRKNPEVHPDVREYLALTDRAYLLGAEGDLRYGPGLFTMDQLIDAQGGRYRRKPKE